MIGHTRSQRDWANRLNGKKLFLVTAIDRFVEMETSAMIETH